MKRSILFLVPALALCAATQARAGDLVDAPVEAGAPAAFAPATAQVFQVAAMGPSFVTSRTYASWKSSVNPADLAKAAALAAIEDALARNDVAALRHALLEFAARFNLTPAQAKALFDRYLGGPSALASVYSGPAAAAAHGPAFSELESVAAARDDAASSHLDSVYSGEAARSAAAASENDDSLSSPAPAGASDGSSASAGATQPAAAAAPQGESQVRAAIAKAFSAFTGGASAGAAAAPAAGLPPASQAVASPRNAQAARATTAAKPASQDFGALTAFAAPKDSKASTTRQGARLLSTAFDNNDAAGKAPATAGSSATGAAPVAQNSPAPSISAGYGSDGGTLSLPAFSTLQSSPAGDGRAAAATAPISGRDGAGISPVIPAAPGIAKTSRNAEADASAGPRMTFMSVPVPTGFPASGSAARTYAALSLLALAGGAGLKLFLGRALRPSATASPLDFNHLLD